MASLRMGPRQTMRGRRSSQAKERTHAETDFPRRRSRWVKGLPWYQSTVAAIGLVSGVACGAVAVSTFAARRFLVQLVELALRAGHGAGPVVAQQEGDALAQHLAQVGGHDQRGDGAEGQALPGVHELLLVAAVQGGLLLPEPVGRLLLGVPPGGGAVQAGGG